MLERVVIVGGGIAGLRTGEALRRAGFPGSVTLLAGEHELPYDRPPLSKEVLVGALPARSTVLRSAERLGALPIEVLRGREAMGLDLAARTVRAGDVDVGWDGLVLATGASARTIPALRGLPGVHTLRTMGDAIAVRDALRDARRLVVVGAGFIGAEVAASARLLDVEATIVEMQDAPLADRFGGEVSAGLVALHAHHGTELRLGRTVMSGTSGARGLSLGLSDGTSVEADVVVVGVGVEPNIGWLRGSGLELGDGVVCDATLNAGHPRVYAVGDIANWPNARTSEARRVEHWTNAVEQARHVAGNLLAERPRPFSALDYFWSDQYGVKLQFAGMATARAELVEGNLDRRRFLVWYRDGSGDLTGAFAMGMPERFMESRSAIARRHSIGVPTAAAGRAR